MKPSYSVSLVVGGVTGLVMAIGILLFVGSLGAVSALNPSIDTGSVDPVFSVPASALWSMTLICGLAGGAILSAATYGVARVIDPDASSVPPAIVVTVGAIVGAVVAIVVMLLGAAVVGTIADGTATVTVVQMVLLAAIAGQTGGATVAWLAYLLARPPVLATDPELLAA
jgi:hypothetical protein